MKKLLGYTVAASIFLLSSPLMADQLIFWDFENPVNVGDVSTFDPTTNVAVITGSASQTAKGPAETWGSNTVHLTRIFGTTNYPFISFTTTQGIALESLTFTHYHNHNPGFPTNPSYDVQLQLDSGSGFVDVGGLLNLSNANYGSTDTMDINVDLAPGSYTLRWIPLNLNGSNDTSTEFFAIDDLSVDGLILTDGDWAEFHVTKVFSDDSTDEVDVTLICNNGLPLEQTSTISGGDSTGVNFVVEHLEGTDATCTITESSGPDGYTTTYNTGAGCSWTGVRNARYACEITNTADPATFTVTKNWAIHNLAGDEVVEVAAVTIYCSNKIKGGFYNGQRWTLSDTLHGDGASLTATISTKTGPTQCSASERQVQTGVETEDDCGTRTITAGGSSSCTITNTVFFEGIPTLNQYGLAIMALLMLGLGMVGFRRFA